MSDPDLGRFARQDISAVLARFAISSAERAVGPDPTEEVILLRRSDFERVDVEAVTLAIMDVLTDTKVLVIQEHSAWKSEPL